MTSELPRLVGHSRLEVVTFLVYFLPNGVLFQSPFPEPSVPFFTALGSPVSSFT